MTQEKKTAFEPRTQTRQDKNPEVQRQSPYSRSFNNGNHSKTQESTTAIFDNVQPVRSVAYDHALRKHRPNK